MRPCQVDTSADRRHRENVSSTSAKKLLEVSLHNLDKLGLLSSSSSLSSSSLSSLSLSSSSSLS